MKSHLILGFCLLVFPSFAQNGFYASANFVTESWSNADLSDPFEYFDLEVNLGNNSDQPLEYYWIRNVNEDCPLEWVTQISDKYYDYTHEIGESPVPVDLEPQEMDALFIVHARPMGTAGCCDIEIIFKDYNDQSIVFDTVNFFFQINQEDCLVTAVDDIAEQPFEIYPNPASDQLFFKNAVDLQQIRIVGLEGKVLMEHTLSPSENSINVNQLPSGVYWAEITNKRGEKFTHKLLKI